MTDSNNIDEISLIDSVVDVKLTNNQLIHLLQILDFAERAASVLCELEINKGSLKSATKMKEHGSNAILLSDIIFKHLDIGEPINNQFN